MYSLKLIHYYIDFKYRAYFKLICTALYFHLLVEEESNEIHWVDTAHFGSLLVSLITEFKVNY